MHAGRTASIGFGLVATLGACVFASPARSDWDDGYYHRWHPHDGWSRPGAPPALIVTPQSSDTARTAAYDAPPPVAYAPLPPRDQPDGSFDSTVR